MEKNKRPCHSNKKKEDSCQQLNERIAELENMYHHMTLMLQALQKEIHSRKEEEIDTLIISMQKSAQSLYEQSVRNNRYFEAGNNGKTMHIVGRE